MTQGETQPSVPCPSPGRRRSGRFAWPRGHLEHARLIKELWTFAVDRKYRWPLGRRPDDHPGLSSVGF